MIIKDVNVLITNMAMKKMSDNTEYCAVGLLSLDDGQKFDLSVREKEIYSKILPMARAKCSLQVSNSKYGIKLTMTDVVMGDSI